MYEQLKALVNKKDNLYIQLVNANHEISKMEKQLKITIGDWECNESPIGRCIYDKNDVYQDNCLYCHQPDERR